MKKMKSFEVNIVLVLLVSLVVSHTNAQEVIFGTSNYVEYQVGTLPLVISVPHGGNLEPGSIPDRTCNNPVYAVDAFTVETALEIKNKLFVATGCYPHMVISHLKRNKLDPNRNLADGACGNPEAMIAWNEFHNFIADARNTANQEYSNQTFFVDLHGHGNSIQRIELGYLLYDDELELPDNTLNTTQYINYSSIKNLALSNVNDYTHAQLLRGPYAFGTLLTNKNFPSVPGQSIPFPGTTSNYYSGGYITANHTCYNPGAPINGLQMELNYSNVRDTPDNRSAFAYAFTESFVEYLNTHFAINWNACSPLLTIGSLSGTNITVYPNPVTGGNLIHFDLPDNAIYEYQMFNLFGQLVAAGELNSDTSIDTDNILSGIYQIIIINRNGTEIMTNKIIITE